MFTLFKASHFWLGWGRQQYYDGFMNYVEDVVPSAIAGGVLLLVTMICVGLTFTRLADWTFYRRRWTLPLLVVSALSEGISLLLIYNNWRYGEFTVRGASPLHDPAEFLVMIFFCVLVLAALPTIALLLIGLAGYRLAPRRKQLQAASDDLSGQGSNGVEASPFGRLPLGFRGAHFAALTSLLVLFCALVPTGLLGYLQFRKALDRPSRSEAGEITDLNLTGKADRLENAVAAVIEEGKDVTCDMKPDRNDPTAVGTKEMAYVIIAKMQASVPHAGWAWIRVTDGDGDVRQGTIRD